MARHPLYKFKNIKSNFLSGTAGRMTVVVDFVKRDLLRASELLNIKLSSGAPAGLTSLDFPPSACNIV